ncbi:HEPN domain-containing protein [Agrobacterium pusense]|uniref:HEPN domain-containing protein n=1 Tax=Agrobacterium pusense TaxID=648995 RepID=UPI00156BB51C|nr:HEPN domain-containing protein [Agrobacterium pusense]QKJ91581.1 hypothetical protein HQN82_09495 [Agrobacterium pusense]
MAKKTTFQRKKEDLGRFLDLFKAAVDEHHQAVISAIKSGQQRPTTHHDYPRYTQLDSGFPSIHEIGAFGDAPTHYLTSIGARSLAGLLGGFIGDKSELPTLNELTKFLAKSEFASHLGITDGTSSWLLGLRVGDVVERYLHRYGIESPLIEAKRDKLIWPIVSGMVLKTLRMRLVVPIALTHFDVDRFRLTDSTYIVRLPKKMQMARYAVDRYGAGVTKMVANAATHAFVSNNWSLELETHGEARGGLSNISENVLDAIDVFFGALRTATGITTGYAQVLWAPNGWALDYYCDLPRFYGSTIRRYPEEFDDYGWTRRGKAVTRAELLEVRRIYQALNGDPNEAMTLAIKRLNSSLTRADAADAVLDAVIGMELLLGDDQNQSLSYKLRLRASALAFLGKTNHTPLSIAQLVKDVYAARSSIVHGLKKKTSKKLKPVSDKRYEDERHKASELLRFVIDALLMHPKFLDPSKIDTELLLRSGVDSGEDS